MDDFGATTARLGRSQRLRRRRRDRRDDDDDDAESLMSDLERDLEDRGRRRRRRRRDEARGEARGTRRLGREREEEIDPDVLRESEVQLDDMFEPAGQPAAEGGLEAAAAGEGDESAEVRETTGPNGERLDADGFAIVEEEDAAARPLDPLEREEERDAPPLDAPEFETRANANGGETEGVALPVAREEPEPAADASEEALSLDELSDLAAVSAGTTTPDPAEEAPRPADDQAAAFEAETGAAEAAEAAEASPDDPASLRAAAEAAAAEAAAAAETARAAAEKAAEAAAKAAAAGGGDAAAAASEEAAAASEASPDDAFAAAAAAAASEPPVETAADGDAPRGPRVTPDMTYEEQQQEFARFAREEAERNDRIAREAAEANEIAAAAAAEEPPRIPAEAESAAAAALGKDESHPGKRGSKKPKASAKEGREEAEAKNGKAKKAKNDTPSDDAPSDDDAPSPSSPDVYDPSVEGYDPTRWTGPRPDEHPMWEKLISNTADEVLDDAESSSGDFSLSFMPAPDPADELAAEAEEDVEEQTEELIDVAKELEEVEEIVEPEEEAAEKVDEAMAEEAEDAADAFEALEEEEEAEGFEAEVGGAEAAAAAGPESSEALDDDSDSDSDSVSASAPAPAPDALAPLDYDSAPAPAPDASSDSDADLDPTAAEIVASLGALIAERSASGDRLRAALGRASAESSAESADATLGASAKLVAFDEDEWEDETAAELEEEEEDETLYDEKRDEAAAEPGTRRNRRRAKKTSSREADADHLRKSKRQAAGSGSSSSSSSGSSSHQHRQRLTASQKRLGWKSGDAAALTPEKIAKHAESGGAKGALSRRFVDSLPETIPARERPFQKWAAMTDDQIVAAPADIGAVGDARASSDAADVTAVAATKSESSAAKSSASSKKTSSKKASAKSEKASSAAPSKKPAAEEDSREDSETEDVRDSVSAAQKTLKRPPPKSASELEAARASLEARAAEEAAAKLALEAEAQAEAEKEFDTTLEAVQQAIEDSRRDDRPISSFMLAPISVVGVLGVVAIAILLVSNRGDPRAAGGAGYQGPGDPRDKEERRRLLGNAADDGKIRPPADSGANLRALFTSAGMRDANGRGAGPGSQRDALEKLPGATESESESVHDLERGNGAAARTSQSRGFFGDQGSTAGAPPPASDAFFRRAAEFTDGLVRFGSRAAEGVRESAARTARMANLGAGDDRLSVRSDHFGGAPNGVDAAAGIHGSRASASADLSSPRFPDAAGVAAVAAMAASEVGPPRGAFSRREMASQSAAGSRDPLASPRSGGGSSAGMSGISRPRTEPPVGVGVATRRVPAPLGAFDRAPDVPGTRSPARSIDRELTGGSPAVTPAVPAGPPFQHGVAFDAGLASGQTSPDAAALRGRIRRAPDTSEGAPGGSAHRAAFAAPPRPHLQARAVKAETTTTTGVLLEREAGEAATGFITTRDADGDGGGFRGSSAPETEEPAAVARKMYEHVAGAGRPVRREEPPRVVKSTTRFL